MSVNVNDDNHDSEINQIYLFFFDSLNEAESMGFNKAAEENPDLDVNACYTNEHKT